jgi:hypothetical protein
LNVLTTSLALVLTTSLTLVLTTSLTLLAEPQHEGERSELRTALLQSKHLDDCEVRFDASDTNLVASYLDE